MAETIYKASKVRAKPGSVWNLAYRHPLKTDKQGKPGRKMRRSTGTTDDAEAQRLVDQMNQLLANDSWFAAQREVDAAETFDEIIVRAFYDGLNTATRPSIEVRNEKLKLPWREEGFSRTLLLGSTGVGKTSLLRHLIGSHPVRDRFPSTSASRTTVADIEIIAARDEGYSCVATFQDEWTAQTLVHECVAEACGVLWDDQPDAKVAERLLEHRDMRFRLSYVLGGWERRPVAVADDDGFDEADEDEFTADDDGPGVVEAAAMRLVLQGYVARIRALAAEAKAQLGAAPASLTLDEENSRRDNFEASVQQLPDFDELVADIMDEVAKRFDQLGGGLVRRSGGWPEAWTFACKDRDEFIRQIRRLSSNHAPAFGTLLTPLVDGIRARGPFTPAFGDLSCNLVLIDGEGLGHAKDSAGGVQSHISDRFSEVDTILLVDSAKAPMLDAAMSALRAVAASGYQDKLAIAFTHFDALKGQANLPGPEERRAYVMASVGQAVADLREHVGVAVARSLSRNIDERCFMVSYLDKAIGTKNTGPANLLGALFERLRTGPPVAEDARDAQPVYELGRLLFAVQGAMAEFHGRWDALLGLGGSPNISRSHWAEIKAFNRRVALRIDNCEYPWAGLAPITQLRSRLAEWLTRYLETPLRWEGRKPTEEEAASALGRVQQEVHKRLGQLVFKRIVDRDHAAWTGAFNLRGRGSTFERAVAIRSIFLDGVPVPGPALDPRSLGLLRDVRALTEEAVTAAGGKLLEDALP